MSKIKEKIVLIKEYRHLKKLTTKWLNYATQFEHAKLMSELQISYMRETTKPEIAPTDWGEPGAACNIIQANTGELNPYVLDYTIKPEKTYSFYCPQFNNKAKPCTNRDCQYNATNNKIFYYDEKYNQAIQKYKAAKVRADLAWAKIFGRVK